LDNLFGPHINNVSRAMGRATERHALLSANLANVNTPGYKRRDLDFNITLSDAMKRTSRFEQWREERQLARGQSGSLRTDGNNVDLEKEVMSIAETELRYQALSDMAAQYFSGLKNVIREGR
jgi:flagellar basal-body rod protein FlgB